MKLRFAYTPIRTLFVAIVVSVLVAVGLLLVDGLRDEIESADVGLVLGNTVQPDGTPSSRLAARLDRAHSLYTAEVFPLVIVSGGIGREGHDEAVVMRDYLVKKGIPTDRIIVDSTGINTLASAVATRDILRQRGLRSVMVITQYFHVPRSKLALRRNGISPVYGAHAHFFEPRDLYSIPRELAGYLKYAFRRLPE